MGGSTFYPKTTRLERLSKEEILDLSLDLINAFRLVKTHFQTALLLQDLLTAAEIKNLAKRLRIAKFLLAGSTQREIADKLHCSLATVTKVNVWLNRGGEGFKGIISKLPERYKMPKNLPPGPIEYNLPQVLLLLTQYALAKRQSGQLEKFVEDVEEKRVLDKSLQEAFDEEFRNLKSKGSRSKKKS